MRGLQTLWESTRVALDALRTNRVRSLLTILGVSVGVSVVVMIAALITGLRSSIMEAFEAAGPDNFVVTRVDLTEVTVALSGGAPPWAGRPELEPEDAKRIARLPGVREALFTAGFFITADFEGRRVPTIQAVGYSAGWPAYMIGDFPVGRNFTPAEVEQNRTVVVISASLAEELFGARDPIGRRIGVASPFRDIREEFEVLGVFDPGENIFSGGLSHLAVFPHTSAKRRLKAPDFEATITVVPEESVAVEDAKDQVTGLLRGVRGLGPRDENDFTLIESGQIIELFDQITGVFFLVMFALSSAGLLVGGVGVIGIMLISVTERTREIGIRKAVGATRREILWQFLVEASVLTTLGGGVGMLIGGAGAEAVERFTPIPSTVPLWAVITALAMAALTGILFGLLPAYRASRLAPVDALRFE